MIPATLKTKESSLLDNFHYSCNLLTVHVPMPQSLKLQQDIICNCELPAADSPNYDCLLESHPTQPLTVMTRPADQTGLPQIPWYQSVIQESLNSAKAGHQKSIWDKSSGPSLHNGQVSSALYWLNLAFVCWSMYTAVLTMHTFGVHNVDMHVEFWWR